MSVVIEQKSQFIVSITPGLGPYNDLRDFREVVTRAAQAVKFKGLAADAGYDAEWVHVFCREELGFTWTAIKPKMVKSRILPKTRYRRLMRTHFPKAKYRMRAQVEGTFSRFKRRLGSTLRSKSWTTQVNEILLRVMTYNLGLIALLAAPLFNRATYSSVRFLFNGVHVRLAASCRISD